MVLKAANTDYAFYNVAAGDEVCTARHSISHIVACTCSCPALNSASVRNAATEDGVLGKQVAAVFGAVLLMLGSAVLAVHRKRAANRSRAALNGDAGTPDSPYMTHDKVDEEAQSMKNKQFDC